MPAFLLIISGMIGFAWQSAAADEWTYYSIHIASFKHLENANKQVNAIHQKGKAVFWKKTDVPGKGLFYRVFIGKYNNREDAARYWRQLKEEGAVSYFGIYTFKENRLPEKPYPAVKVPEKTDHPPSDLRKNKDPQQWSKPLIAAPEKRFIDNLDGTITDTQTNLMWIKNGWRMEFVSAMTWQEAVEKCRSFNLGGYSDWRLSSIKEWKSIIDDQKQFPALIEPNPFENVIVHMPYWSDTEFILGGNYTARRKSLLRAYTVMLYSGDIRHQRKSDRAFVLPVRSVKK